ncbi:hypothetical protein L3Q82_017745 [Scortum barcoo]|uniref:Uncharacterized protein n=1 Tax=Scortum barcoo TaxID=214431 RepID=A0ACB8VMA3_9TELE|nr:hypothetical protein L3Q82_017745 [Scortum barcoo]
MPAACVHTVELRQCEKCRQSFSDSGLFACHPCSARQTAPSSETELGNYKCSQCHKAFTKPCELKHHFKTFHSGHDPKGPFACTERGCQFSSTDRQEYQAHVKSTHSHTPIPCTLQSCKVSFLTQAEMERHLRGHMPFGCFHCQFVAPNAEDLNDHLLEHNHQPPCSQGIETAATNVCTDGNHQAQVSNRPKRKLISNSVPSAPEDRSEERHNIKRVRKTVERDKPSAVDMMPPSKASQPVACFQEGCSFQSSLRKELLKHAAEVHGVRAVECRHHACGAIFRSETDMEAHHRTHLAYHCSQCDFSCSNKSVFLQHQRHGHPGNDKLCCDFCFFVTFNPVEFEQHIGHLHASEKIHRCSQCSYVTSHKRGLKRHMLMHSGEKPHKCSLCDFRCRDESYLSKHMLTHSEDKNFMCAECGYVTKWKHYLNVHMRKHAGDLRYQCDQCPYRCHRMDQLNSHKLRHQAKSLMCEICAYACKRKYELRNHMLAKHSGVEKQPSVYKCKYCTYTTCYRQALQNHENCKHTKLKEFRCALCFYSSFSSISLFLHKRKAHGYVPGDKAWLENYAAKEKERNSTEFLQDFYNKPSTAGEQSQREQSDLPGSGDHSASNQTEAGSQTVDTGDVFNVVSQEVVNEVISDSPPSANSPEEYCTLVLTTLPTSGYQTPSLQNEENCANQPPSSPSFNCKGSDISQQKANSSTPSSEADDVAMAEAECEQSDLDDNYEPLNNTNQPVEAEKKQTQVENNGATIISTSPSEQNQPLESEIRLKAMKKHDKDQAEAMVMEGRVQMLVVPTKDVYHCDKCSYVTSKETALKYHCRALCHGRIKGHKCQACGAQFKQKRGLDSHLAKKCPALPRKARAFVGPSNLCLAAKDNTSVDQKGSKQLDEVTNSKQTEPQPSQNVVPNAFTSSESGHQQSKTQTEQLLKVKLAEKLSLYSEKDGKFKCKLCNFSSVKLATVERHLSTCRKIHGERENEILSEVDGECGQESAQEKEDLLDKCSERIGEVSEKHQIFSCPNCAFKCNQRRALDSHEKRGCLKPDEVQCTMCSFVAKSKMSLTRHILRVHNKKKFAVAKPQRLHCQHCTFTCKQERCMAHHVELKHKGARPHHCRYCPFSTTRRYRLDEHESLHTGLGRHRCDVCDKTFGAVTKLHQHKMRIHDRQPTHFCSLCDFSGYTLDDVRRHNLRCHTGELHHACTHCDARFSSEVALRNHCKRVHQLQVCFSCKQCDYTCSSEVILKIHQDSKHPEVKCTTCQESFETKERLEIHQRTHLAHQCQLCPFATKTRQQLAQHLLNEHEEGSPEDKPLRCSTCQFTCRHQLVLEQHLRSHGGKRLYKCADCEYSTQNKQKITWHIRIHTGEKPYSCEQCSYTCTDPSRLKLHMRVHQEEKKYLCPECGYKCKWATQLKYHMTKHTGDKPYACNECDYRTNRADALRAHRDTQHRDERPYVCEKCGKVFKTSFILKTHQRQHSDDRPYTCGLCHKAFRWPAGLRHHYLSHTKQQPFCCRYCSYRAKQKFQVVKHLQRHHPEMAVEKGVVRDSEAVSLTLKEALHGTLDERAAEVEEEEEGKADVEQEVVEGVVQRGEDSETKR